MTSASNATQAAAKNHPSSRPVVRLNDQHRTFSELVGDWNTVERVVLTPGAEPIERRGKTTCRTLLGGRAAFTESELTNPDGSTYESFTVMTWNVNRGSFEGIFMDGHSFDGFDLMSGGAVKGLTYAEASSSDGGGTAKRIWSGSITVPKTASLFSGGPEQLLGVDRLPVQFIEHKISDNKLVLDCIMTDAGGNQYVGIEWTLTRQQ